MKKNFEREGTSEQGAERERERKNPTRGRRGREGESRAHARPKWGSRSSEVGLEFTNYEIMT